MRRRPPPPSGPPRESPAATLRARGLRPRKALGQNFLADPAILAGIVEAAGVGPDDTVLEIGPGTGLLTRALAERAGRVIAVELDRALAATCRETLADLGDRVRLIEGDALDGDRLHAEALAALPSDRPWKLVANLPYQVAAGVLVAACSHMPLPAVVVVTIQREMADRLRAQAGTAAYGGLGVRVQLLAEVEVVRHLPAGAFWPAPKVRSSVVRLRPRPGATTALAAVPRFDAVLRACFDYRRKRAATALAHAGVATRAAAEAALVAVGARPDARGEVLTPTQLLALARLLVPPST